MMQYVTKYPWNYTKINFKYSTDHNNMPENDNDNNSVDIDEI